MLPASWEYGTALGGLSVVKPLVQCLAGEQELCLRVPARSWGLGLGTGMCSVGLGSQGRQEAGVGPLGFCSLVEDLGRGLPLALLGAPLGLSLSWNRRLRP